MTTDRDIRRAQMKARRLDAQAQARTQAERQAAPLFADAIPDPPPADPAALYRRWRLAKARAAEDGIGSAPMLALRLLHERHLCRLAAELVPIRTLAILDRALDQRHGSVSEWRVRYWRDVLTGRPMLIGATRHEQPGRPFPRVELHHFQLDAAQALDIPHYHDFPDRQPQALPLDAEAAVAQAEARARVALDSLRRPTP
jgi:hypothetical protein